MYNKITDISGWLSLTRAAGFKTYTAFHDSPVHGVGVGVHVSVRQVLVKVVDALL